MYEHPATEFVAGFIGTSNILERDGRTFTVRPEKIRLLPGDAAEGEPGVVRATVYLGPATKFVVALDAGGELTVVQQNLETSGRRTSIEMEGKRVRLSWRPGRGVRNRGGGNVKRIRFVHVALAALVAALAVPAAGVSKSSRRPDVGREGRGQADARRLGGLHREAVGRPVREADRAAR